MADSRVHKQVETWITQEWLLKQVGQPFTESQLPLESGGVFRFDAVSEDHQIVANISTSALKTSKGKHGTAKIQKIRSDIYFLILVRAKRKLIVLSERDMHTWWLSEVDRGRVPAEIEFLHATIPDVLDSALRTSRQQASQEVTRNVSASQEQ